MSYTVKKQPVPSGFPKTMSLDFPKACGEGCSTYSLVANAAALEPRDASTTCLKGIKFARLKL